MNKYLKKKRRIRKRRKIGDMADDAADAFGVWDLLSSGVRFIWNLFN